MGHVLNQECVTHSGIDSDLTGMHKHESLRDFPFNGFWQQTRLLPGGHLIHALNVPNMVKKFLVFSASGCLFNSLVELVLHVPIFHDMALTLLNLPPTAEFSEI